ncbi:MAG TPA: ECF-type sigma factor [Gemmatimonadales bacterium]|nr:ECF-type sigma factor [Gemmatimonadales bacterium]
MHADVAISDLIRTADTGDPEAAEALFATLYRELHAIAERQLRRNGPDLTLGTTTLLHEAYLNITEREGAQFVSRGHFLGYAARAMRGLTIDYVRRRQAKKRGGEFHITASGVEQAGDANPAEPLAQLGEALDTLARSEPDLAQLVDLHFFCGFSFAELAELQGVSERTVRRHWRNARLLLHRTMQDL